MNRSRRLAETAKKTNKTAWEGNKYSLHINIGTRRSWVAPPLYQDSRFQLNACGRHCQTDRQTDKNTDRMPNARVKMTTSLCSLNYGALPNVLIILQFRPNVLNFTPCTWMKDLTLELSEQQQNQCIKLNNWPWNVKRAFYEDVHHAK